MGRGQSGGGVHLVSWEVVGNWSALGIGIRNLRARNSALLGKW